MKENYRKRKKMREREGWGDGSVAEREMKGSGEEKRRGIRETGKKADGEDGGDGC